MRASRFMSRSATASAPAISVADAAGDARSGVAGRLRDEIVGIAVQDDGVADDGVRAGVDR